METNAGDRGSVGQFRYRPIEVPRPGDLAREAGNKEAGARTSILCEVFVDLCLHAHEVRLAPRGRIEGITGRVIGSRWNGDDLQPGAIRIVAECRIPGIDVELAVHVRHGHHRFFQFKTSV
jgi:hypothetical protein